MRIILLIIIFISLKLISKPILPTDCIILLSSPLGLAYSIDDLMRYQFNTQQINQLITQTNTTHNKINIQLNNIKANINSFKELSLEETKKLTNLLFENKQFLYIKSQELYLKPPTYLCYVNDGALILKATITADIILNDFKKNINARNTNIDKQIKIQEEILNELNVVSEMTIKNINMLNEYLFGLKKVNKTMEQIDIIK